MEKNNKISIILPTYNGSKHIRQAIKSCLRQTHKNIELIIVDDGSTDKTPEIVKSFRDLRIKFIRHKKNKGLPAALNTGFEKAQGDYITWTSDDNFFRKDALEKMFNFLKAKKCDLVYADYYRFDEKKPRQVRHIQLSDRPDFKNKNEIGACFLYTKKVKDTIGKYDKRTFLAEDLDYWIRVFKKFKICHLRQTLYFYRDHQQSLTARKWWEIKVIATLVRIKHKIWDAKQGEEFLIKLILKKKKFKNKFLANIISKLLRIKILIILKRFEKDKKIQKANQNLLALIQKMSKE